MNSKQTLAEGDASGQVEQGLATAIVAVVSGLWR